MSFIQFDKNSKSAKEDIPFKLELQTANVTRYHEKIETENCTVETVNNARSKFMVAQQKGFMKLIEIFTRINGHVHSHRYWHPWYRIEHNQENWFWTNSSQDAFVHLYANFHFIYDFASDLILSQAAGKVEIRMKDILEGCLSWHRTLLRTKLITNVLVNQVTNKTGEICHFGSGHSYWRVHVNCCRMVQLKNNIKCKTVEIENRWFAAIKVCVPLLLVLLMLCTPAFLLYVRQPYDYLDQKKLIRPDSPANPVTTFLLKPIWWYERRRSKSFKGLIIALPAMLLIGAGWSVALSVFYRSPFRTLVNLSDKGVFWLLLDINNWVYLSIAITSSYNIYISAVLYKAGLI